MMVRFIDAHHDAYGVEPTARCCRSPARATLRDRVAPLLNAYRRVAEATKESVSLALRLTQQTKGPGQYL